MRNVPENVERMFYDRMTLERGRNGATVPKRLRDDLKRILSTLSFKWDSRYLCWNVVCTPINKLPYIIMQVRGANGSYLPINDKTFEQIRKSIWWSTEGIARQARKMAERADENNRLQRKADKERHRDYAKEMAYPLMNVMNGNSEWNTQSNYLFAGHGESKVNT